MAADKSDAMIGDSFKDEALQDYDRRLNGCKCDTFTFE